MSNVFLKRLKNTFVHFESDKILWHLVLEFFCICFNVKDLLTLMFYKVTNLVTKLYLYLWRENTSLHDFREFSTSHIFIFHCES